MSVHIKTAAEIEKMREAGQLAAQLLDYITPFVKVGVTTNELNQLAHDYQVNVQGVTPATLNYTPEGCTPFQNQCALRSITLFVTAFPMTRH